MTCVIAWSLTISSQLIFLNKSGELLNKHGCRQVVFLERLQFRHNNWFLTNHENYWINTVVAKLFVFDTDWPSAASPKGNLFAVRHWWCHGTPQKRDKIPTANTHLADDKVKHVLAGSWETCSQPPVPASDTKYDITKRFGLALGVKALQVLFYITLQSVFLSFVAPECLFRQPCCSWVVPVSTVFIQ